MQVPVVPVPVSVSVLDPTVIVIVGLPEEYVPVFVEAVPPLVMVTPPTVALPAPPSALKVPTCVALVGGLAINVSVEIVTVSRTVKSEEEKVAENVPAALAAAEGPL